MRITMPAITRCNPLAPENTPNAKAPTTHVDTSCNPEELALKTPWRVACYIKEFGITDQEKLAKIARICVDKQPHYTLPNLHKFGLNDQSVLEELAKSAAKTAPDALCSFIHELNIEDESVRFELAKACAAKAPNSTGNSLKNFQLTSDKEIIDVVALCNNYHLEYWIKYGLDGGLSPGALGALVTRFPHPTNADNGLIPFDGLTDKHRNHLAVAIAYKYPVKKVIQHLSITEPATMRELGYAAIAQAQINMESLGEYGFTDEELCGFNIRVLAGEQEKAMVNLIKFLLYHFKQGARKIIQLVLKLPSYETIYYQLTRFFFLCTKHPERLHDIQGILALRIPSMRPELIRQACSAITDPKFQARLEKVPPIGRNRPWQQVMRLKWANKPEIDPDLIQQFRERIERRSSRFASCHWHKPLLVLLSKISDQQLQHLLQQLLDHTSTDEAILEEITAATALIDLNLPIKAKLPSLALEEVIQKAFGIVRDDFAERYRATFGRCRDPNAALRYHSNMESGNETEVQRVFNEYVQLVLDGTFKEARYELDKSEHIRTIFTAHPEKLETWKTDISASFDELQGEKPSFCLRSWMQQTLPLCDEIKTWLETGSDADWIAYENKNNALRNIRGKDRTPEMKQALAEASVQHQCWKILHTAKKTSQSQILKGLKKALRRSGVENADLMKEIDKGVQALSGKTKGELHVYETDNPYDLLLCGTDIEGSCQSVDYPSADYSKCLVGYLLNGRSRVMKVASEIDGKFQARAILRLVWNEESKVPVLLMERIYPKHGVPDTQLKALQAMAKRKADLLGVDVVHSQVSFYSHYSKFFQTEEKFKQKLWLLPARAPHEYVDVNGTWVNRGDKELLDATYVL